MSIYEPTEDDWRAIELIVTVDCPPWCDGHARWEVERGRVGSHHGGLPGPESSVEIGAVEPPFLGDSIEAVLDDAGLVTDVERTMKWEPHRLGAGLVLDKAGGEPYVWLWLDPDLEGICVSLDEADRVASLLSTLVGKAR